jgi:exopolysaccharide biosynthesis polyprenyl glycosylphosphotransferase
VVAGGRALVADWRRAYALRLAASDALLVIWSVFGAQLLWFGVDTAAVTVPDELTWLTVSYTLISAALAAVWLVGLGIAGTREHRIVGSGPEEYKRVVNVSVQVFALVAIVGFALQFQFSRGYLLIALPAGLLLLLLERWLWRRWLGRARRRGEFSARCVVVGGSTAVRSIASTLAAQPAAGYLLVAAALTDDTHAPPDGLPLVPLDAIPGALDGLGADTVVVAGGHGLTPAEVRELSWSLEPGAHRLVMVPDLVDVAGPRIQTRPVAGLPLMHVETPTYRGAGRFMKRALDVTGALIGIVLLAPLLAVTAIAIRIESPGPVLFVQERVGIDGRGFRMLKFRSMAVDAEARLAELKRAELKRAETPAAAVLFKLRDDPRMTRVGRLIRRFSIDELPQLVNVLGGSMSLVGPRPPLPGEVGRYAPIDHRRLLVKPGLTGLWQVSGRSDLTWEESIRLDLYYVENWSLAGDAVIVWRTIKAVLTRQGAY